jgi:hypothetical protein
MGALPTKSNLLRAKVVGDWGEQLWTFLKAAPAAVSDLSNNRDSGLE